MSSNPHSSPFPYSSGAVGGRPASPRLQNATYAPRVPRADKSVARAGRPRPLSSVVHVSPPLLAVRPSCSSGSRSSACCRQLARPAAARPHRLLSTASQAWKRPRSQRVSRRMGRAHIGTYRFKPALVGGGVSPGAHATGGPYDAVVVGQTPAAGADDRASGVPRLSPLRCASIPVPAAFPRRATRLVQQLSYGERRAPVNGRLGSFWREHPKPALPPGAGHGRSGMSPTSPPTGTSVRTPRNTSRLPAAHPTHRQAPGQAGQDRAGGHPRTPRVQSTASRMIPFLQRHLPGQGPPAPFDVLAVSPRTPRSPVDVITAVKQATPRSCGAITIREKANLGYGDRLGQRVWQGEPSHRRRVQDLEEGPGRPPCRKAVSVLCCAPAAGISDRHGRLVRLAGPGPSFRAARAQLVGDQHRPCSTARGQGQAGPGRTFAKVAGGKARRRASLALRSSSPTRAWTSVQTGAMWAKWTAVPKRWPLSLHRFPRGADFGCLKPPKPRMADVSAPALSSSHCSYPAYGLSVLLAAPTFAGCGPLAARPAAHAPRH